MRGERFAKVSLTFLSSLYNAAWRLTGNERDAEDLVQATYETAFRHAVQLRSLDRCKAWLFRIMRNCFLSVERKRRARPELVLVENSNGDDSTPELAQDSMLEMERQLIARMAGPAIARALGRLSEEMRAAVLLCDLDGFTYQEIAEIMQCPVGTVRSRIARARQQLMHQLSAQAQALGIGGGGPK